MANAAGRLRAAYSLALLAWVLIPEAASAHGHGRRADHSHSRGHRTVDAVTSSGGSAEHSTSRSRVGNAASQPAEAPMPIKLAAAAKADIAAKALRARKADMYPGSPARRALAEDPNLAVR